MFPTGNGPGASGIYNPLDIPSQNAMQNMYVNSATQQMFPIHPNQTFISSSQPIMNNPTYPVQMINPTTSIYHSQMVPVTQQRSSNQVPAKNKLTIPIENKSVDPEDDLTHSPTYAPNSETSDDDLMEENAPAKTKEHSWQAVTKKRKRSKETTQKEYQIQTSNKYQSLPMEDSHERSEKEEQSNNIKTKHPKPPPIYIYGVTNFQAMIDNLAKTTEEETYYTRTLSNNTVKINPKTPETYRKLVRHLRDEEIVYHTYQPKEDRAYRIVIRDLHHSILVEDIKQELTKKGHKIRNVMNIKHRATKEPLPLFFVDLEPCDNNKSIFDIQYLFNTRIRVEPPRKKNDIIQCTRCQSYGHSKTYCSKPYNCVKCGKSHDSKLCTKSKSTPATCALCHGSHPSNYKGCSVYKDLVNIKNKNTKQPNRNLQMDNIPTTINPSTNNQQFVNPEQHHQNRTRTYSQVASGTTQETPNNLENQLNTFLTEFKNMFTQLLNQNSMILSMLTTVISKLTQ